MKKRALLLMVFFLLFVSSACGKAVKKEMESFTTEDQGMLKIEKIGAQTATYEGDKYIVSDGAGDIIHSQEYQGLHELCVIKTPSDWEHIEGETWGRNNLQYIGVSSLYGMKTVQYKYINCNNTRDVYTTHDENENELPVEDPLEEYLNQAVNDRYEDIQSSNEYRGEGHQVSMEMEEIKTVKIDDKDVLYRRCDLHDDMEAVIVYSVFERNDSCALCVSAAYEIQKGYEEDVDEISLLEEAYSNISLYDSGFESIEASSPAARRTIVSPDNRQVCILDEKSSESYYYDKYQSNPFGEENYNITVSFIDDLENVFDYDLTNSLENAEEQGYEIYINPEVKKYSVGDYNINAAMLQYDDHSYDIYGTVKLNAWFETDGNWIMIEYDERVDGSVKEAAIDTESVLKTIVNKMEIKENPSDYNNEVKNKNAGGAISGGYDMEKLQSTISKVWMGEIEQDGETHTISYFQNEDASECGYLRRTTTETGFSIYSCIGTTTISERPMVSESDGKEAIVKEINITSYDNETGTYYTYEEDGDMYISFDEGDRLEFILLSPSTTDQFMATFERFSDFKDDMSSIDCIDFD